MVKSRGEISYCSEGVKTLNFTKVQVFMKEQKKYGMFYFIGKDGKRKFRKPNKRQRKQILIYYLRRRSGRTMTVKSIAKAFHVSERTIQTMLKELEQENIIRREKICNENGFQKANKIIYLGDKSRLKGNEPSIDKIYDESNPMNIRDFSWEGFLGFEDCKWLFLLGAKEGWNIEDDDFDED